MTQTINDITFEPSIWGPHFWFFIHTIAMVYPNHPNETTKKKYYDFFHNLSIFIPNEQSGKVFDILLDEYPITPYLDSKESLIRWTHFIHNKVNEKLEQPKISLNDFYNHYIEAYKKPIVKIGEFYKWRQKLIYIIIIIFLSCFIAYLYKI